MIFTPNNIMAASRFLVDPKANKVMTENESRQAETV